MQVCVLRPAPVSRNHARCGSGSDTFIRYPIFPGEPIEKISVLELLLNPGIISSGGFQDMTSAIQKDDGSDDDDDVWK